MADTGSQALTMANTNIKVSFELERALIEFFRTLIDLIPDPTVADTMRKEMEKGHVNVELIDEKDKSEMKDLLSKQGMKEGKDYIFGTWRRPDGEPVLAIFYNIKDEEKVLGEKAKIDPAGRMNKENNEFYESLKKFGVNIDGTVNKEQMDKFFQSCGVDFRSQKEIPERDLEYASKLISSKFNFMSEEQKNAIVQKLCRSGAIEQLYATKAAGIVGNKTLLNHATDHLGRHAVKSIHDLKETDVLALSKRAEMYGLKIAVNGSESKGYTVSFAQKDEDIMRRVQLDAKYDLYGEAGEIYKKTLVYEAKYSKQVLESVINGEYPDGKALPDGCMLVGSVQEQVLDRKGNPVTDEKGNPVMARQTLEISGSKARMNADLHDKGAVQTFLTSKNDYEKNITKNFGNSKPVLLNPSQAKAYKEASSESERMKILERARVYAEHGISNKPVISRREKELIKQHEKMRMNIFQKLEQSRPTEGKLLSSLLASPLVMYVKDQIINNEQSHDKDEYFSGGNNFINEAEMESSSASGSLSEEERRFIKDALESLEDAADEFDVLEDGTKDFEVYCMDDCILGEQGDLEDISVQIASEEQSFAASNMFEQQSINDEMQQ